MEIDNYKNQAVWDNAIPFKTYPSLIGELKVDVAIVGAGITGLSTAVILAKAGKKVVILEQFQVGKGTTGSSTGNLYATIDERLYSIGSKHNDDIMRRVAESRLAAITFIEQRIQEYRIECDFRRVPWHLFTTKETCSQNEVIEKEREAAIKAGLSVKEFAPLGLPFNIDAVLTIENQAQFDPLRYVQQLAAALEGENCQIYENTKVTKVEDGNPCTVYTGSGKVTAEKVVMATHSPLGIYAVHTAMETYREFAIAAQLIGKLPAPGVYWHLQPGPQFSIRPYSNEFGDFLLVLGEPYKVGSKTDNKENFKKIETYLRSNFEVESIKFVWAAQNYKPADNLPYIGKSPLEKNTYIATGFAADGLVYGTLSGMIISESILGIENTWADMYDPRRFTPVASAIKFVKENISVASHLLKDYLFYGEADELKEIKAGEGKTIKLDGEHLAAYRDDHGGLHLVSGICTHMGCVVHWNRLERSWDCPCHGSRFSVEGKVLEGPAYNDLSKPEKSDK